MLRDVMIALINKGQLLVAFGCGLAALLICRMPPQDISRLVFRLLDGIEQRWLIGDIVSVVALGGWFLQSRRQRRVIAAELERLGAERDKVQSKAHGQGKFPSSKGPE
jgi:hypothetical protein